eukprot:TRINITY_DN13116_c0_g1_i1.p1 TRINITY_DN13116_c0_g1~~TRINITY_DN13116_c0_g1_i1.p1  ORF type:complete len:639 (+),score=138.61 TRINITY_DN13116_c0_g1_i1:43-1959(+)
MVLGDITNTIAGSSEPQSSKEPIKKPLSETSQRLAPRLQAASARQTDREKSVTHHERSNVTRMHAGASASRESSKAREADGDKVLLANALWEANQRRDPLLEQVLEARARMKELKDRKAKSSSKASESASLLQQESDKKDNELFQLSEKEVKLKSDMEVSAESLSPVEKIFEQSSLGVQAKETEFARGKVQLKELRGAKVAKEKEGERKVLRAAALEEALKVELSAADLRTEFMAENVPVARSLHNGYLNLKGNIRVFCRYRPKLASERDEVAKVEFHDEQRLTIHSEITKNVTGMAEQRSCWEFGFDRVFGPSATQADIFEEISMLVQSAMDGYRVAIFAYGQTGGGKTYTMDGPQADSGSNAKEASGVIPRTVDLIFSEVEEMKDKGWSFEITCTLLEVYNDAVYDTLASRRQVANVSDTSGAATADRAKPAAGTDGRQNVEQFTCKRVDNAAAVHLLLAKAARERRTASTACNHCSSRSHAVFQLSINGRRQDGSSEQKVSGLLSLVDLAGSERVEKSQVTGERLKEAQHINKSLSALGDVVEALARRGSQSSACSNSISSCHIPYRNSRLTMLLKDSLGGDSKALMFVNVSPCQQHLTETLSSLRFASKVHACNIGVAKRNAVEIKAPKQRIGF